MSLTPIQLNELQTIVETLRTEFPSSDDVLWEAAIRIQKGGLGPVTGPGGQAAFDAAVADIVLEAEQISTVQGRQGGLGNSVQQATFSVVPVETSLPNGTVGGVIYLDVLPNVYAFTDVIELNPPGANSVILSEVGTQVARTVAPASGGMEVNNLATGAGFERVLTLSDMGGGVNSLTAGVNINLTGTAVDPIVNLDAAITGVSVNGVTLSNAGAATNFLDETGNYSVPAGGSPGGANTSVQFNNGGAFGGFGTWDGSTLEIPASQAQITLDETDGGGIASIFLTSTTTADSGIRIEFDSTSGTDARIRQVTSGGVAQDIWITFAEDAGVGLRFNDVQKLITLVTGVQFDDSIYIVEKAAANADTAGQGQLWVRDDAPNVLVFTDDTGVDTVLGGGFDPASNQTISGVWEFTNVGGLGLGPSCELDMRNSADTSTTFIQNTGTLFQFGVAGADFGSQVFDIGQSSFAKVNCPPLFVGEQAAAEASVAGDGQVWVRNDAPNTLMFTDDAGTDFIIGGALAPSAGAQISGVPANNQIAVWTGATDIEGDANLQWDGTDLDIAGTGGLVITNGADAIAIRVATDINITTAGSPDIVITGVPAIRHDGVFFLLERAAALADVATYGQIWVANTSDGELMFTDEAGFDMNISESLYSNSQQQAQATLLGLDVRDTLRVGTLGSTTGNVKIGEQANADVDEAGYGQLWVRNDTPNNLFFTDDSGNDFLVAGTGAGGDMSAGSNLIAGTSFVAVANVGPEINTEYIVIASVEVTAPAADDMNIQFTIDTNARFYGTLTNTEDDTTQIIEGQLAEVVTNNVLVPTSGSATPAGTYVTIIGRLIMGATTGTMSLRCAKNADTGADGFAIRGAIKLIPIN